MPFHNRISVTRRVINCLQQQTFQDYKLIAIDDGSSDGSGEFVKASLKDVVTIEGDGSLWWAGSLQSAYSYLKGSNYTKDDLVLIINDDILFDKNFLQDALTYMKQFSNNTLLLAMALSSDGQRIIDTGTRINWFNFSFSQSNFEKEIDSLSTRGLFLYVDFFVRLGGFYPMVLPHYLSDYEFTIRAKRKGGVLVVSKRICIRVNESTSGLHNIDEVASLKFLSKYFSKKNPNNPFYQTIFILLACPWIYKVPSLMFVWKRCFFTLAKFFLMGLSNSFGKNES